MFRSAFGIMSSCLAVLYFGGLIYYFTKGGSALDSAMASGLGPTLIGLGILGLIAFGILLFRIVRAFMPAQKTVVYSSADRLDDAPQSDFDPDAAVARYLERKIAQQAASSAGGDPVPPRPEFKGFGRRV